MNALCLLFATDGRWLNLFLAVLDACYDYHSCAVRAVRGPFS